MNGLPRAYVARTRHTGRRPGDAQPGGCSRPESLTGPSVWEPLSRLDRCCQWLGTEKPPDNGRMAALKQASSMRTIKASEPNKQSSPIPSMFPRTIGIQPALIRSICGRSHVIMKPEPRLFRRANRQTSALDVCQLIFPHSHDSAHGCRRSMRQTDGQIKRLRQGLLSPVSVVYHSLFLSLGFGP